MKWTNYANHQHLSEAATDYFLQAIKSSPKNLIGIATGFSPKLTYQLLANRLNKLPQILPRINIMQLDEWHGLGPDNMSSCHYYIQEHIIEVWGLKKEQCTMINGEHINHISQIENLKKKLTAHPLDICILGLGKNGHLALNEPGSKKEDTFRMVELATSSQQHTMLTDNSQIVENGITIGLKEILESKLIMLLISGADKKKAYDMLKNKTDCSKFPASALYFHDNVHCFVNEAAVN